VPGFLKARSRRFFEVGGRPDAAGAGSLPNRYELLDASTPGGRKGVGV